MTSVSAGVLVFAGLKANLESADSAPGSTKVRRMLVAGPDVSRMLGGTRFVEASWTLAVVLPVGLLICKRQNVQRRHDFGLHVICWLIACMRARAEEAGSEGTDGCMRQSKQRHAASAGATSRVPAQHGTDSDGLGSHSCVN